MYGNWAITEELASKMLNRLGELNPKTLLECGSGTSTLVLGEWADSTDAKLTSLEHDDKFLMKTQKLCKNIKSLELILAPISDGFYNAVLPDHIDFVLIDGPPSNIGRIKTLPKLWDHLSDQWEIWLDDANRDHEKECLEYWMKHYPISIEIETNDKGLAIIKPSE